VSLDLWGFAELRLKNYDAAIDAFNRSISLNPENCYAFSKLARAHGKKALTLKRGSLNYRAEKNSAYEALERAKAVKNAEPDRVKQLERWLKRKLS
jgi:tetratricopeptide (TPR) repeat protein